MTTQQRTGWDPDEHSAERRMQAVVDSLNGPIVKRRWSSEKRYKRVRLPRSEQEIELRRLVERWRLSGPNLIKLFAQEPELASFPKKNQISFYPTNTGRGHLDWSPAAAIEGVRIQRMWHANTS